MKKIQVSLVSIEDPCCSQLCYIPAELLRSIRGKPGQHLSVLTDDGATIGKAVPVIGSECGTEYNLVVANCITTYKVDYLRVGSRCSVCTTGTVVPLKSECITCMEVTVVVKEVSNVLHYRRNRQVFMNVVKNLLSCYQFCNGCFINCQKNPVAKVLGISFVFVESCSVALGKVGKVTDKTDLTIRHVESEAKREMSVRKKVILGGLGGIYEQLHHLIVTPWSNKALFESNGISYPSGVLLIGPPGCGKTSLVQQLCSETGFCLVATNTAELVSPFIGTMRKNLREAAGKAIMLGEEARCVFFIDEIDSLCPIRTKESNIEDVRLTSQLILTIDEVREQSNVFLMAATNRPYAMDPAVRRSGRFDLEILLNVPSVADRLSILKVHAAELFPEDGTGLESVADATCGFVGADLKLLCSEVVRSFESADKKALKRDEIIGKMKAIASQITPSIYKTLDFITAKPKPVPVGGLKQVREELESIFTHHLKYAEAYKLLGLRKPRGVLLYGPRGCGKTRLIVHLASKFNCTFICANASHLLSSCVGESEKKIAALFHVARISQPTILFIDEIDGIFGRRDSHGSGVFVSLLNEFLQAMDGADRPAASIQGASVLTASNTVDFEDGVLICAATNHPHQLDSALFRPGRFDRLVYIPLPDYEARLDILQIKMRNLKLVEEGEELEEVARKTGGFSGAEIESLIRQAVISAISEEQYDRESSRVCISKEAILSALKDMAPSVTDGEIKYFLSFQKCSS